MNFSLKRVSLLAVGCLVLISLSSNAARADEIPALALAGTYTATGTGSFAICIGYSVDFFFRRLGNVEQAPTCHECEWTTATTGRLPSFSLMNSSAALAVSLAVSGSAV